MPHFICLLTFTQRGMEQLGATTKRAEAFERRCEQLGAKVLSTYWTLGMYDLVHIIEAEDEKTSLSIPLSTHASSTLNVPPIFTSNADRGYS